MQRPRTFLSPVMSLALLLSLTACGGPADKGAVLFLADGSLALVETLRIGNGTTFHLKPVDACDGRGQTFIDTCDREFVAEIIDVEIEDRTVVQLRELLDDVGGEASEMATVARLVAVAAGETTVTITARFDDGTERVAIESVEVVPAAPRIVNVEACGALADAPAPLPFFQAQRWYVSGVDDNGFDAHGVYGFPFEVEPAGALLVTTDPASPMFVDVIPQVSGPVTLTPQGDVGGAPLHLYFYEDGEPERLDVIRAMMGEANLWESLNRNESQRLQVRPVVNGRRACPNTAPLTAVSVTSVQCSIEAGVAFDDGARIRGREPGMCRVNLLMAGLMTQLEVEVED
jgi:hypothetical protein